MRNSILNTFLLIVGIFVLCHPISAASMEERVQQREERAKEVQETMEMRKESREQQIENRCALTTQRIENRITSFYNLKDTHISRHQQILERLQAINTKLKEKGYDTSKLEQDVQTMNEKIVAYATAYEAFITELEATKQYPCGESEGAFLDQFQKSRTKLLEVRSIGLDIRIFYQSTIKPDVRALREQHQQKQEEQNAQDVSNISED